MATRLDSADAWRALSDSGARPDSDFHTLPSAAVESLIAYGRSHGYRKPRGYPGSYGRAFHAYCVRIIERESR